MSQWNDVQQRQLVSELVAAVKRFAPSWTNKSNVDPGTTLLELFAWLSDQIDFRLNCDSGTKSDLLRHLIGKLSAMNRKTCTTCDLTHPHFFNGQLLTAADFQSEQDYTRKKMRLHNRCIFGAGIVGGLRVTVDSGCSKKNEPVITIAPGCAIDPCGEQLSVCEAFRCVLRARTSSGYVVLRYNERGIDLVPTSTGAQEFSRIEEGVAFAFEEKPLPEDVAIARLT